MGAYMILKNMLSPLFEETADMWPLILTFVLVLLYFGSRKVMKKKMTPIMLIVISAVLGIAVYGI